MIEIAKKYSKIALKLQIIRFGRWIDRNLCMFKEFDCHVSKKYHYDIKHK